MKLHILTSLISVIALIIDDPIAFGQVIVAPDPAQKAGVIIEPVQGNAGPESEFTNRTAGDLGILYGKSKFFLKAGKSTRIPIPQQPLIDLKIFEKRPADEQYIPRFDGKVTPNAQKRFIPIPLAKPYKKEEAQQAAP